MVQVPPNVTSPPLDMLSRGGPVLQHIWVSPQHAFLHLSCKRGHRAFFLVHVTILLNAYSVLGVVLTAHLRSHYQLLLLMPKLLLRLPLISHFKSILSCGCRTILWGKNHCQNPDQVVPNDAFRSVRACPFLIHLSGLAFRVLLLLATLSYLVRGSHGVGNSQGLASQKK